MWLGAKNEALKKELKREEPATIFTKISPLSCKMSNVKRDSKFVVNISAENSAGQGPWGRCIVDTTKIPTGKFIYDPLSLANVLAWMIT